MLYIRFLIVNPDPLHSVEYRCIIIVLNFAKLGAILRNIDEFVFGKKGNFQQFNVSVLHQKGAIIKKESREKATILRIERR